MRSNIGWRGERSIPYKSVETVKLTVIRNGLKRTISASGGLYILLSLLVCGFIEMNLNSKVGFDYFL